MSVVRLPDPPWLRERAGALHLIPGENHRETFGYHLMRDGERVTDTPLRPGEQMTLQPGAWQAAAVEWSGLEGVVSRELRVQEPATLTVLAEVPEDFSWIIDRWTVHGDPCSRDEAMEAPQAVREVLHRAEGVFRIERYEDAALISAEDINSQGFACRRDSYADGVLAQREIWQPMAESNDRLRTREVYAPDGFITETTHFGYPETDGPPVAVDHWWYEEGMPVRRERYGGATWEKQGEDWLRTTAGGG